MPTYEYERADGSRFELRQSFHDDALTVDPETGQAVRRLLSVPPVIFKGSGWYITDSRPSSSSSESAASSNSSTSTTDDKPKAESTTSPTATSDTSSSMASTTSGGESKPSASPSSSKAD